MLFLATSCEELTHWKRPWCWEGLGAGGEGDDRGWDGWMASPTRWTWVWVNSGSWWWTGRPGVLRFRGSQRVGTWLSDWTELNYMWKAFRIAVYNQYFFVDTCINYICVQLWAVDRKNTAISLLSFHCVYIIEGVAVRHFVLFLYGRHL